MNCSRSSWITRALCCTLKSRERAQSLTARTWGSALLLVIDLSHTIEPGMPVYPGDEPPELTTLFRVESSGFYERRLVLGSHTGTHMDAPAHMIAGGATLDHLPADKFTGPGLVLDVRGFAGQTVPLEFVQEQDLSGAEFVLLRSDWDARWGDESYFHDYPTLSPQAAAFLAGQGLKGIGVDVIGVDPTHPPAMDVHLALLNQGMIIVENLCGLGRIPNRGFNFCALPLKLKDADGSPLRAVAIID